MLEEPIMSMDIEYCQTCGIVLVSNSPIEYCDDCQKKLETGKISNHYKLNDIIKAIKRLSLEKVDNPSRL
jgi:hypothetical protein